MWEIFIKWHLIFWYLVQRSEKSEEANVEGGDYCVPVNTSHKGFSCIRWENKWNSCRGCLILLWRVLQELLLIYHSWPSNTCGDLRRSLALLIQRGAYVMNQVFSIYLVTLKIIIMFLFYLFFVFIRSSGISVPVIQYTITTGLFNLI